MHDPLTVAWEIKWPWKHKHALGSYRRSLVTIWHKDPCTDGTDSSCYHHYTYRHLNAQEKALNQFLYDAETIFDNRPHYPDSREHHWFQECKKLRYEWRLRRDLFRIPWRWHIWHYRIQIHILQSLYRWLFVRCTVCGKRFGYQEPVMGSWSGTAIWHFKCDHTNQPKVKPLT